MPPPLYIAGTRSTPTVVLDPAVGRFAIAGNSLPENTPGFYRPVMDWLEAHLHAVPAGSRFTFLLPYFNTSSMKALFMLLRTIQRISGEAGKDIAIGWQVEEDDEFMIEAGENFSSLLDHPLQLTPLSADEVYATTRALDAAAVQRTAT
ncbi:MAG: DUF1987 domain-containing protein [Bacteroidetes bacterium]|nr:DUF1987 domain-containing protein [Bacteroidota bacterium]